MSVDEPRPDREIRAFLERYADELVVGTRPAEAVADALAARLGRPTGWVTPALRLGWVIIVLALLAVALPAIIILGGRAELSAADLVARSQAVSRNPPPFVMTLQVEGAEMRFSYDGAGSALIESLAAGPDGFGGWVILSAGTDEGFYNPDDADPWTVEQRQRPVLGRLAVSWWSGLPIEAGATELPMQPCAAPERLADGVVAGRAAYQIACGPLTFWLDAETLLVLRVERDGVPFAAATSIELMPDFAADTFSFDASRFIGRSAPTPAPIGPGEGHTPWHGQLLDGGEVVIGGDSGRPQLVYAWADWCDQACFRPEVIEALVDMQRRYGERIDVLAVAVLTQPDGARDGVEREHLAGLRVPVDAECQVLELWGRDCAVPLLLLYDAQGRVTQTWGPGEADPFPTREALEAAVLAVLDDQP